MPVAEQDNRLFGTIDFYPITECGHGLPLDLRANYQRCAAAMHPVQADFDNVFGSENSVPPSLKDGSTKITLLAVKQDDLWRGLHGTTSIFPSVTLNESVFRRMEGRLDGRSIAFV